MYHQIQEKLQNLTLLASKIASDGIFQSSLLSTSLVGEYPIALTHPKVETLDSPYAQVRSRHSLQVTDKEGIIAQLVTEPIANIENLRTYQFGTVIFHILDENGLFIEEKTVQIGHFKTFEFGRGLMQVAEFLATVFDIELTFLGFRAFRNQDTILFQGMPEKAGLNLLVADLFFEQDTPYLGQACDFGIRKGMSTLSPGQTRGKAAITSFGRIEINGVTFDLHSVKRKDRTVEKAKETVLGILHEKMEQTKVYAAFDSENCLLLTHLEPGSHRSIAVKNIPELTSNATERIPLNLPDGIFCGKDQIETVIPETDFGSLTLNHVTFRLGRFRHLEYTVETATQEIISRLNAQTAQTGIMAGVDAENRLILSPIRDDVFLSISHIQDSDGLPLEVSPLGVRVLHIVNQNQRRQRVSSLLAQFVKTYNQLSTQARSLLNQSQAVDAAALIKQSEEAILGSLPENQGLYVKEGSSHLLGPQLALQEDLFWKNWQQQAPRMATYFAEVIRKLDWLVTSDQESPGLKPAGVPAPPETAPVTQLVESAAPVTQMGDPLTPAVGGQDAPPSPAAEPVPVPARPGPLRINMRYLRENAEKQADKAQEAMKPSSFDHTI